MLLQQDGTSHLGATCTRPAGYFKQNYDPVDEPHLLPPLLPWCCRLPAAWPVAANAGSAGAKCRVWFFAHLHVTSAVVELLYVIWRVAVAGLILGSMCAHADTSGDGHGSWCCSDILQRLAV